MLGSVATSLCVVAVGLVGIAMMNGRVAIGDGIRVAMGCFLLFGAPVIAAGLLSAAEDVSAVRTQAPLTAEAVPATPALPPPANYDPYAGASLRVD